MSPLKTVKNKVKGKTQKQDNTLKKFGIISAIIFTVIVVISLLYINSCHYNPSLSCSSAYLQSLQAIILSSSLIGLGYCLIVLRGFDVKVDQDLENNYQDMIKELEKSNNNVQENKK